MEENTVPSVFDEMALETPMFAYATSGQRFVNFIVDYAIFYGYNILVFIVFGFCMGLSGYSGDEVRELLSNKLILYSITIFDFLTIYTFIEAVSKGRSLGKVITKTQAVNEDMTSIKMKQAFLRSMCRLIPFEVFSGLGGYTWHDRFTKTYVVKKMQQPL
jgi:uncharacterized RDD family membrane protein YckC